MFEQALELISQNIEIAPWIVFGLLVLAGFNIPVSEDALSFTTAMLAVKFPKMLLPLFIALYFGAWLSDFICFSLGRFFGPKLKNMKMFKGLLSDEKLGPIKNYYQKYGIWTLILGRFIPFGVRNPLFMTAGLAKMPPLKFLWADAIACVLTTGSYFTLFYLYGEQALTFLKKFNVVIFSMVGVILIFLVLRRYRKKSL